MDEQAPITEILESQHRWVDGRFERFRELLASNQVDGSPFDEAAKALHRHMYLEEEIIFPEVEARGLMGPTQVMAREHGEICRFMNSIQDLVAGKAPPGQILDSLNAVRNLLEQHNLKEEEILYPSADQLLAGPDLPQVLERLNEAQPPADWSCRADRGEV